MVKQLSDVYQIAEVDGSALGITALIRLYTFVKGENFDAENLTPDMFKSESLNRIETIMSDYFKQSVTVGDPRGMNSPDALWSILGSLIPGNLDDEIKPLVVNTRLLYDSSGFGTTGEKTISYIIINPDGTVNQVIKESVSNVDLDDSSNRYIFMSLHDISTEIQDRADLDTKLADYYAAGSEEAAHDLATGDPKHWNTEKVPDYKKVFYGKNSDYHPELDNWTMTQATEMTEMFAYSNYNHDLNCLERKNPTPSTLGNMTDMDCLFCENGSFNNGQAQGESSNPLLWKTDSAVNMLYMFGTVGSTPSIFNQRLGDDSETYFNTSTVKFMHGMFRLCVDFNQSINHFKTGNVDPFGMGEMFMGATSFNNGGDMCIGDLDVSKVENFSNMFFGAVNFDQPINSWNVKESAVLTDMVNGSGLFLNDTYSQGFKDVATPGVELFGKPSICGDLNIPVENAQLKALMSQIIMKRELLTSEHTVLKDLLATVQEKNSAAAQYVVDNKITDDDKNALTNSLNNLKKPWQKSLIGSDRYFNQQQLTKHRNKINLLITSTLANSAYATTIELYTEADGFAQTARAIVEGAFLDQKTEMTAFLQQLKDIDELEMSSGDEAYMVAYIVSLETELLEIQATFDLEEALHNIPITNITKYQNEVVYARSLRVEARGVTVLDRVHPAPGDLVAALDKWYELANMVNVETANNYSGSEYVGNPKFWDVSNINDMSNIFYRTGGFIHPDISLWDVCNVTAMVNMFEESTFNNEIPIVKRKDEEITVRMTLEDINPIGTGVRDRNDGFQNTQPDPTIAGALAILFGFPPSSNFVRDVAALATPLQDALIVTNTTTNEVHKLDIGNGIGSVELIGSPFPGIPDAPSEIPIKIVKEFTMKTSDILHIKSGDARYNDIHFTIEEVVTDTIVKPRLYYSRTGIQAENLDLEIKMPSAWNTKNVTTMAGMFKGGTFNGDIGSWDVCNVKDFSEMFKDNKEFDNDGSDAIDSWFYKRSQ